MNVLLLCKCTLLVYNDSRLCAGWVLGVLLTVWVWDTAAEASEWGSLCFEALLHNPDDGGSVACQLLKRGKKNTQKLERISVTQMHADAQSLLKYLHCATVSHNFMAPLSFIQVSFQREQLKF